MLYTMILDYNHYLPLAWDQDQIISIIGDDSIATREQRIDMWNAPRTYMDIYKEPLHVHFSKTTKGSKNCVIPDIGETHGRLFLTPKAYKILEPLIKNDGEFLPLVYEHGEAYFFNPLRSAEDVGGLDTKLSRKNEWGDLENLAFHEDKVKDWAVFRTGFNDHYTLQCQRHIKEAIEQAGLKGLYITPDLGCIFASERDNVADLN